MSDALPRFTRRTTAAALRRIFDDAGYCDERVAGLLGLPSAANASGLGASVVRLRTADGSLLATLVRLFVAGITLTHTEITATLQPDTIDALTNTALLEATPAGYRATVRLVPADGLLIACDRIERHLDRAADFVVGPSPVSQMLAALTLRKPVERALDLACGAGILALLAARHSRHVVALDVNARATALTRFNAALNALDAVETIDGNLFAPLHGQRFDLIVSNPPFVIGPDSTYLYRDGGEQICVRIVREAPAHLVAGGCLQMLCNWPERAGEDWRTAVTAWFAGTDCDAWVLRLQSLDAMSYAAIWLTQEFAGQPIAETSLSRWMEHLSSLAIASVGTGLVVMRRPRGRKPWLEVRDAPTLVGAAGASIASVLAARDFAAHTDSDDTLLTSCLRPSPDLEYRTRQRPGGNGWQPHRAELKLVQGLAFAVNADPVATRLIGLLDGQRTLREAVDIVARGLGVDSAILLPQLPAMVRQLLHLGLLIPAD